MDTEDIRQKEAYKMELQKRVETLLRSGISTKDIASILGGEEFLRIELQQGHKEPVTIFDARSFVESRLMEGKPMRLPDDVRRLDDTILPPGDGEIVSGSGRGIEAKDIVPRTTYVMELLEEMKFSYTLFSGTNTPNMMREFSYVGFYIPQIQKLVFVNNEEGNATFVVHTVRDEDDVQLLLSCTKQELRDPNINDFPTDWIPYTAGSPGEWKNILKEKLLSQPSPNTEILHERRFGRNKDSALKELGQAFNEWQALPKENRGKFNSTWLETNGYGGLYFWTRQKGNTPLETLVEESTVLGLAESFERQEKSEPYTAETALRKLENAFNKWHTLPGETRGKFNSKWLEKNGYRGLCWWTIRKGNTPLEILVSQSAIPGLAESFERQEQSEPYTAETALRKLENAFNKWHALPEENRGKFNSTWLETNGYGGLCFWTRKKGNTPLETLVEESTVLGLAESFEKQERYTEETALEKLEEAFREWQKLPKETQGKFNSKWLQTHGYKGLYDWTNRSGNPSLETLAGKSKVKGLSESFTKQEKFEPYTAETALSKLEKAFGEWQALPQETRGRFTNHWLTKHGYSGLSAWERRKQGAPSLETLAGKSKVKGLSESFTKQEKFEPYTAETALSKLEKAFGEWQALPKEIRGRFNPQWLETHGYSGLCAWERNKQDAPSFETLAAKSEVKGLSESFEKREKSEPYTAQTALSKLEQAFGEWQALPKEIRGRFNPQWLETHGYSGLYGWARKKSNPSLETLVSQSKAKGLSGSFKRQQRF